MKKADFIQVVAEKAGLSKKDTVKVVDSALEAIKELLVKGDDISFIGHSPACSACRMASRICW